MSDAQTIFYAHMEEEDGAATDEAELGLAAEDEMRQELEQLALGDGVEVGAHEEVS